MSVIAGVGCCTSLLHSLGVATRRYQASPPQGDAPRPWQRDSRDDHVGLVLALATHANRRPVHWQTAIAGCSRGSAVSPGGL